MVIRLTIEHTSDLSKQKEVFEQFEEATNKCLEDHCLFKLSYCNTKEYVYCFLEEHEIMILKYWLSIVDISVLEEIDYTQDFLNLIRQNRVKEFISQFDFTFDIEAFINKFYMQHASLDIVLDKINECGIGTLNKTDLSILQSGTTA